MRLYNSRSQTWNLDSARQSQIEAQRSERGGHSKTMADEAAEDTRRSGGPSQHEAGERSEPARRDRFGEVAASPNSKFGTDYGIFHFVFVVAALIAGNTAAGRVAPITQANFEKEVRESKGVVVLEAYAVSCGPCKMVAPIFSEVSKQFERRAKFGTLNVGEEGFLSKELGIRATPTFLFFKGGKVIDRHVGTIDQSDLSEKVEEALNN